MAPVSPSRAGVGSPDGHHTGTLGVSRRINIVKGTGDGCMKELDLRVYSGESIQAVMDRARRQLPASKFETTLRKILLSQDIAVFEAPVHSRAVYDAHANLAYVICDKPVLNPVLTAAFRHPHGMPLTEPFLVAFGRLQLKPSPASNITIVVGWKRRKVYMLVVLGALSTACLLVGSIVGLIFHNAELGTTVGGSVAAIPAVILAIMALAKTQ